MASISWITEIDVSLIEFRPKFSQTSYKITKGATLLSINFSFYAKFQLFFRPISIFSSWLGLKTNNFFFKIENIQICIFFRRSPLVVFLSDKMYICNLVWKLLGQSHHRISFYCLNNLKKRPFAILSISFHPCKYAK